MRVLLLVGVFVIVGLSAPLAGACAGQKGDGGCDNPGGYKDGVAVGDQHRTDPKVCPDPSVAQRSGEPGSVAYHVVTWPQGVVMWGPRSEKELCQAIAAKLGDKYRCVQVRDR